MKTENYCQDGVDIEQISSVEDAPLLICIDSSQDNTPRMPMMAWLSTDGGRRCPMCGRFAKEDQLGYVGYSGSGFRVSAYGHLPGFGCNNK